MKKFFLPAALVITINLSARDKDSTAIYHLPDSIKAVQYYSEIKLGYVPGNKTIYAGIRTDVVQLYLEAGRKDKEIVFEYPRQARLMASGLNTDIEKGEISFDYNWSVDETYKLLISQATDSAGNFSLYSGYVFLPKENKWKLVGTCRIEGRWSTIQEPATFYSANSKQHVSATYVNAWVQRNNGSWKNLRNETNTQPVINLAGHLDSVAQRKIEITRIESAINAGLTDVKENVQSVYYKIMKEGNGNPVSVNDTVSVFYKVTLFNDTAVIDQAKDKPATFPLKRLIRGWQIGIPICHVGCKIKLVIPSDLAYSIRTRGPEIPPNSILEFEIEVVDTKPAVIQSP